MSKATVTKPVSFRNESLNIEISGMLYEGKPVFFAVEVAKALGYERPQDALAKHCKSLIKINFGEMPKLGLEPKPTGVILLTEPDLYRLILRSKLPSAEKVQDWVCEEVLPSIRQTGGYQLPKQPVPQSLSEALRLAADLAEQRDEAIRTKALISQKREATACQLNSVYQRIANRAIKERDEMASLFGASKDYASVRSIWRATGTWYNYRPLVKWQDEHDAMESYYWDESTDARILCYPREAWLEVYGVDISTIF
ncbi:putative phage anti-repressor protein [Serratia symbiotica str. Tucson]|uniref:Phage anti-repressor protein n=3 Tax=Serratia symbiotica TaxID=138074 RepID=A0A455VSE7_9GAMM|nr:BRO family protein [Serratia symbiotica]EFW11893.1 putative phage anti-repressor protein [Serratia symbiotica str. Tucson]BBI92845.1 phage anti-repressor protein [Serratia symbiotica]